MYWSFSNKRFLQVLGCRKYMLLCLSCTLSYIYFHSQKYIIWYYAYTVNRYNKNILHFFYIISYNWWNFVLLRTPNHLPIYRVRWVSCRRFIFLISRMRVAFSFCRLRSTVVGLIEHGLWEKQHHQAICSFTEFNTACCIAWHSYRSFDKNISKCLSVNLKTVQRIRKEFSQSNGD